MKRDSAIRTLRKLLCVQILVILWNRTVKCTYEPIVPNNSYYAPYIMEIHMEI